MDRNGMEWTGRMEWNGLNLTGITERTREHTIHECANQSQPGFDRRLRRARADVAETRTAKPAIRGSGSKEFTPRRGASV